MSMHDSSPERRNLNVLSIAVILYYIAGGTMTDTTTLKMPLVNLEFKDAVVLQWSVIFFLGWFLYRYWLMNKQIFAETFSQELYHFNSINIYRKIIDKDVGHARITIERRPGTKDSEYYLSSDKRSPENRPLKGFKDFTLIVAVYWHLLKSKPAFSGYVTSYILFGWAISLIVLKCCFFTI